MLLQLPSLPPCVVLLQLLPCLQLQLLTFTSKLDMSPWIVVTSTPAAAALSRAYASMLAFASSAQTLALRLASCTAWLAGPHLRTADAAPRASIHSHLQRLSKMLVR
jgi:hypothetical protein